MKIKFKYMRKKFMNSVRELLAKLNWLYMATIVIFVNNDYYIEKNTN